MTETKNNKNKKFDCYQCEYREEVAGSSHSSCNHPSVKTIKENPMLGLLAIFASVGRVDPVAVTPEDMKIKLNEYGVKNGWANFPFNFDPLWIENCDGFVDIKYKKTVNSL
jgi:hypothetical protein